MGRVPRAVRAATPFILAIVGAVALAQPANLSEAEDERPAIGSQSMASASFGAPVVPPETAEPAEIDYIEPKPAPVKNTPAPAKPKASSTAPGTPEATQAVSEAPSNALGTFSITCYSLGGNTSSGQPVGPGIAAADFSIIPMGTRISIDGVGEFTVLDRGPRGRVVDIWKADVNECRAFGRQRRAVTIVTE